MRRLSNIEWTTFQDDVDVDALHLPEWGGIVEWNDMDVLVFEGPTGELFLSDVTDMDQSADPRLQQWKDNLPRTYDPTDQIWYYRLPETFMDVLSDRVTEVSTYTEETAAAIAETAKQTVVSAGDIVENIGSPWFLLALAGLAAIVLMQMTPKHSA